MKKIKLALALLSLVCLTGCNKEETWRNDAREIKIYNKGMNTPLADFRVDTYPMLSYITYGVDAIKIKLNAGTDTYYSNVSYVISRWSY